MQTLTSNPSPFPPRVPWCSLLLFPFLPFLLLPSCSPDHTPPPSTALPETQLYPEGISRVTGFAVTEEFFAATPEASQDRALVAQAGFHWIRTDLIWSVVEQEKGKYTWDRYDTRVEMIRSLGLEPLLILDYGNPLYTQTPLPTLEGSLDKTPPDRLEDFARFAREAATHFRGKVRTYEIWNEPNAWFRFWLSPHGPEPERYARLVQLTVEAIREVCPECQVITGGMVYLDYPPFVPGQNRFFTKMLREIPQIFHLVDGIGFHYYTLYPPANPPEWEGGFEVSLETALKETHKACACTLPIFITETGWPTHALSEANQAAYGLRTLFLSLMYGVKTWLWFSVRELDPEGVVVPHEAKFAVLRRDGSPKPLFSALQSFLERAGNATGVTDLRRVFGLEGSGEFLLKLHFPRGASSPAPGVIPAFSSSGARAAYIFWNKGDAPSSPLPSFLRNRTGYHLIQGVTVTTSLFLPEPVYVEVEE